MLPFDLLFGIAVGMTTSIITSVEANQENYKYNTIQYEMYLPINNKFVTGSCTPFANVKCEHIEDKYNHLVRVSVCMFFKAREFDR